MRDLLLVRDATVLMETAEGPLKVLEGVGFSLAEGEFVALVGLNGSGKSTLLKAVAGLIPLTGGEIVRRGRPDGPHGTSFVFQNPSLMMIGDTVLETVAFGLERLGLPEEDIVRRVREALEAVGIGGLMHAHTGTLSGGQQQLAAVASALAADAGLMLFDEAASMLDPPSRRRLLDAVRIASGRGNAVVWATHSMDEAALADRILALEGGRLRFDGSPRDFFYGDENGDAPCRRLGLEPPVFVRIAEELEKSGRAVPERPLDENGFWSMVERLWS